MRIGILIKDFAQLGNWELRIINEIRKSPTLKLALLIKDGRSEINSASSKIKRLVKSKNILARTIFKVQTKIETRLFIKNHPTVEKDEILEYLNSIDAIQLFPRRKGFLDIFSEEDAEIVKQYDLDIILRHEFNIIRGPILNASRYGIWSFHHGDNAVNRGGPAGFWEIVLKEPVVGVTLQQLTSELDGGLIIDKGYYNPHWTYARNSNTIFEQSVELLFKNIRKLERGELKTTKSPVYYGPLYRAPTLSVSLKYVLNFYSTFFKKSTNRVLERVFKVRHQCWTLFVGNGSFPESTLFRLKPIKLPKDEFWADPFLFKYKEEYYVFFESYSYKIKLGKIACGRLKDGEITDVVDVLNLNYHLSYPFIIEEDNEIYLIPETSQNKRLEIYRCIDFPTKWELYSTAFEGESLVDTTYYVDDDQQKWLFINKGYMGMYDSELHIYKIDSLKLNHIESHSQNPVIIDSRVSRNAGPIFKYEGKTIRPSQNNSKGVYGFGLNLNEIVKLTLDEYVENNLIGVKPNFIKGLVSIHHLHQLNGKFVIDGAFNRMV